MTQLDGSPQACLNDVVWHGSAELATRLLEALARNCTCTFTHANVRTSVCPGHLMLVSEQRSLDGLLYAHHIAPRLLTEEFATAEPAQPRRSKKAA